MRPNVGWDKREGTDAMKNVKLFFIVHVAVQLHPSHPDNNPPHSGETALTCFGSVPEF